MKLHKHLHHHSKRNPVLATLAVISAATLIVLVATNGSYLIAQARSLFLELETGSRTNVTQQSSSSASGGKYVQFTNGIDSTPTPDPDPEPEPIQVCRDGTLITIDPDQRRTSDTDPPCSVPPPPPSGTPTKQSIINGAGLSNPAALSPSGSITTSSNGQVIQNLDISGVITIKHDNVTIKNVRVSGTTSAALIRPNSGVSGTTVEHCEVHANMNGGANGAIGFLGNDTTVRYCEISGFADGIKAESNSLYEYNYIHMNKPPADDKHLDGIQGSSDTNYTIRYNAIEMTLSDGGNSSIFVQAWNGSANYHVYDVRIEGNYLRGGNYVVYLQGGKDKDGSSPASWVHNYQLINNVFDRAESRYGYVNAHNCSETTVTGNVFADNGAPVPHPC